MHNIKQKDEKYLENEADQTQDVTIFTEIGENIYMHDNLAAALRRLS